jgi:uncharacterized repeat protein (TIGR01451 family)
MTRSLGRWLALPAVVSGLIMFAQVSAAVAATFTVTTTADSGAGSLRQAITDVNAAGTGNTIAFAIPGAGPFTIAPASVLPQIAVNDTTIDGCTQPGADCSALPFTLRIRISGQPLQLLADNATIRGLSLTNMASTAISFNRWAAGGSFHYAAGTRVEDNYIGLAPDGSAAGSSGRGLQVSGQNRSVGVLGWDGTQVLNNVIGGNTSTAIDFGGQFFLAGGAATGVVISGNLIGLDPTGTQPRPNGGDGLLIEVTGNLRIENNSIANNAGVGIRHRGRNQKTPGSSPTVDPGTLIQGNAIRNNTGGGIVLGPKTQGADPYSGPVNVFGNTITANGAAGISITGAAETLRPNLRVGGTAAGQANTITANHGPGVAIGASTSDTSVAVSVRGNSIYANTGPKVDLANDGATANGPAGTARTGPNALVNFPLISSIAHGSVIISGTYAGAANATYTLDFYKSPTADGAQTWIGSTNVTTDADGNATFRAELVPDVPEGWFIAATATDAQGSTSEFDDAVVVPPVPPVPPAPPVPPPAHDLSITDTASHSHVTVGDTVTYTLVAKNAGPDAASDLRVTDTLPSRLDARSASTTQGTCSLKGNALSCSPGAVAAAQWVTVKLRAVAIKSGSATDAAKVLPPAGSSDDPANNTSSATVRIAKVTLGLTQALSRTTLRPGQTATYTIRVHNPSKRAVHDVRVCDDLPSGLVYASSTPQAKLSNGRYCWTAKSLAAGRSQTYRLTIRALSGASGRKVNRASANSSGASTNTATGAIRVLPARAVGGGVTG